MSQHLLLEGLTALQIFDDNVSELKLSWVRGLEGADRKFPTEAVRTTTASSNLVGGGSLANTIVSLELV
jgi:HPr kinase/phosphorylase